MDSLTHLVAGALTPLAFPHAPRRTSILLFGIIAGEFPDIDMFLGNGTLYDLLEFHRGITHALVLQPIFALILAFALYFYMANRRPMEAAVIENDADAGGQYMFNVSGSPHFGFVSMFLVALIGLTVHLYLDCMTTFGTQIFLPFSKLRVAFPSMFIVDLLMLVPILVLLGIALVDQQLFGVRLRDVFRFLFQGKVDRVAVQEKNTSLYFSPRSVRCARFGLAWVLLYPLLCLGINSVLDSQYTAAYAQSKPRQVQLLTEPLSPFAWKLVCEYEKRYTMGTVFMFGGMPLSTVDFTKPDMTLYSKLEQQEPLFTYFRAFCPTLAQLSRKDGGILRGVPYTEYAFADLRYVISPQSPARIFGRTVTNFVFEARVSAEGKLLAWRFLSNSGLLDEEWRAVK